MKHKVFLLANCFWKTISLLLFFVSRLEKPERLNIRSQVYEPYPLTALTQNILLHSGHILLCLLCSLVSRVKSKLSYFIENSFIINKNNTTTITTADEGAISKSVFTGGRYLLVRRFEWDAFYERKSSEMEQQRLRTNWLSRTKRACKERK